MSPILQRAIGLQWMLLHKLGSAMSAYDPISVLIYIWSKPHWNQWEKNASDCNGSSVQAHIHNAISWGSLSQASGVIPLISLAWHKKLICFT